MIRVYIPSTEQCQINIEGIKASYGANLRNVDISQVDRVSGDIQMVLTFDVFAANLVGDIVDGQVVKIDGKTLLE